ncbi:MAG: hypothetical protein GEU94_09070 [Micromonosporaceae bacterium]|nr:hypothetical protein [Micromonosporaceae bacterium]
MGYRWWPRALERLAGVEPYEVSQVLAAPRRRPRMAVARGVKVLTISGRTSAGRPLLVFVRQDSQWDWLIIGAREMTPDQVVDLERWEQEGES